MLLLLLSALWGGSFFFFKVLVAELPPFTVVLGRVGFAAIILNLYLLARHQPLPLEFRRWRQFLAMGLLNNAIPFSLIVYGETHISSGLASILNATTPVFSVIVAHFLTATEKLTLARGAGVLLGLGGVTVLIGPEAVAGLGSGDLAGQLACLAAALSYALAGIYGRRFRDLPPLSVATGQVSGSTLILLPVVAGIDQPWTLPAPSAQAWLAFAGIAFFCTVLAYLLYFRILRKAGATNLLLVTFLLPISALLLGWLALGETIGRSAILGMAVIGAGLACIDGRPLLLLRRAVWRRIPAA
ncbi:MAG TPA: DMT family transporter [Dongiaceae bacterium]|nr:DMT family transporter [Dongiaceae bacterium]